MYRALAFIATIIVFQLPEMGFCANLALKNDDCQATLTLQARAITNGVEIECTFVCSRGSLKLDNAMFDGQWWSDSSVQVRSEDGRLLRTLVEPSFDSAKHRPPPIFLGAGDSAGRQFQVKLPPGKNYSVYAEYFGLAWSSREKAKVRQLVMAAECKFDIADQPAAAAVAVDVANESKCPLQAVISLRQARLTASDDLEATVRLSNVSDKDVWGFNLNRASCSDRCTWLVLDSAQKDIQINLLEYTGVGPLTRTTAANWQVMPPGGFLSNQMQFSIHKFTVERGLLEGRNITPFGKFKLDLRLHAAMLGKPPRGIPYGEDYPDRINETLTYGEWRRIVPGEEIFRSKPVEFEVVTD